jgi:tripeptidyl-peptidase-1
LLVSSSLAIHLNWLTKEAMYNITQATKAASGNEMGIFEEGDYFDAESLVEFFATFAP